MFSWYMGWQVEKPLNLEEKSLQFAPKALFLGCSLQYEEAWGHGPGGMPFFL